MTPQDPGVYISPAQMYQELRSMHDALSRVEAKVDGLRDDYKEVKDDVADHESRLRSLERGRWPLPSLAVLVSMGALAATLYTLVTR